MFRNDMRRAADLKVDNFAEGTVNTDIAKSISDHFASQNIKILSIQECRNKIARVTFADQTACECVQLRGELDMGGVKVSVVPPPPPPPRWTNVVVYNYPYDAPEAPIKSVLGRYGTVQNIRYQYWTNLPEVSTGTRIVRINLKGSIPRFVMFGSYRCKVWYRGQPVYCDICKEATHIAFNCPFKGKCMACKGVGHFARNCPTVCFKYKGGHASDSCPNRRGWERVPRDDDDFQSVTSEVGADVAHDDVDEAAEASVAQGIVDAAGSSTVGLEPSVAPGDSLSVSLDDERFNQLDDLHSSPDDAPESQSVLAGMTQIVQDACEVTESSHSPAVTSPAEQFKTPDICMAVSSAARKRVADEIVSSDESRRDRSRSRKVLWSGFACSSWCFFCCYDSPFKVYFGFEVFLEFKIFKEVMALFVVFWLLVGVVVCYGLIAVQISNCPSFVQIPFFSSQLLLG